MSSLPIQKTAPVQKNSEEWKDLASRGRLRDDAAEGKHGKAAVLQLLELHGLGLLLVLGQEALAQEEVAGLALDLALEALQAEPAGVELEAPDARQEGSHDAGLHHLVVSLQGRDVLEDLAREADAEVRRDPADGGKHADASMLQL